MSELQTIELPPTAGELAKLTGDNNARYSLNSVHMVCNGTILRLEATNGNIMGLVQVATQPQGSELELLIPVQAWRDAFAQIKDGSKILVNHNGESSLQVVSRDQASAVIPFVPVEGRFPNCMGVLPDAAPLVRVRVDAQLLIKVLQVAMRVCPQQKGKIPAVDLMWWGNERPMGIMTRLEDVTFDGLIMPLGQP